MCFGRNSRRSTSSTSPVPDGRAVILPEKGALIGVVPAPAQVATIEDWVNFDGRVDKQESKNSITLRRASGASLLVTEAISQSLEGMETIGCYFEMLGHLFVGRVTYWKGASAAGQYREVLHEVIENTTPLVR